MLGTWLGYVTPIQNVLPSTNLHVGFCYIEGTVDVVLRWFLYTPSATPIPLLEKLFAYLLLSHHNIIPHFTGQNIYGPI